MLGQKTLDQILVFTRNTARWRMGPARRFVSDAINVPSLQFSGMTTNPNGVLSEIAATNVAFPSMPRNPVGGEDTYYKVENVNPLFEGGTQQRRFISKGAGSPNMPPQNGFSWTTTIRQCCSLVVEIDPASPAQVGSLSLTIYKINAPAAVVTSGSFSFATGTFNKTGASGTATVGSAKLMDVGPNGGAVYLLWVTDLNAAGDTYGFYPYPVANNAAGHSIIIHHAQLEGGSLPTTPIVTTTAQGTRGQDLFLQPSLQKLAFNPNEGTVVVGFVRPQNPSSTRSLLEFGDGTLLNRFFLGIDAGGSVVSVSIANNVTIANISDATGVGIGEQVKIALAYKAGQYRMAVNGRAVKNAAPAAVPVCDRFGFGGLNYGGNQASAELFMWDYIPQFKDDATLINLSRP